MTPRQILMKAGYRVLKDSLQTSRRFDYYGLYRDDVMVSKAGIETLMWSRNPCSVVVYVGDKPRYIEAHRARELDKFKPFDLKQQARLYHLIEQSLATGAPEPKVAKPRPLSPNRGVTMSDQEKAERRIWRWLGEFHVCGYIDKEMQQRLSYIKVGKHIRVEDLDSIMAYAPIRDEHLKEIGMTIKTLEEFLISKGVKRKQQKRIPRSVSYYD